MIRKQFLTATIVATLATSATLGLCQAHSRGTAVVYPVVFDQSGTDTSRAKAKESLIEILKKGGFEMVSDSAASKAWTASKYGAPTITKPPAAKTLASFGKAIGARYVCTAQVTFHSRSIWVNLGPKTISNCNISVTIVDSKTGKIAFDGEGEGRSDEKSDALKVAGALLLTPLVTAVSGGPKTPQEVRAGQIAAARALQKFVTAH